MLIHLAWVGSDRGNRNFSEIQQRNVLIAENIVSVLKDTNISRLIGVGSQDELLDGEQPWQDHSKIYPTNAYSKAKNQCFEIFSESITNFTWARLFSVYGRNDKRSWVITEAVKAIKNNTTVSFGNCSKPWSLTHINDVCLAFELLLENRADPIRDYYGNFPWQQTYTKWNSPLDSVLLGERNVKEFEDTYDYLRTTYDLDEYEDEFLEL